MASRTRRWTTVAFGDVVRKVSDRVDPETSGLGRYVAGEHMDTDDLRLRRWGVIGDGYLGPAFHMRFKPGQALYGSRRTYLRKVAVPDFEGVTANTTFVLESKDSAVLLPELLPFVMSTESFHSHSIEQSKGSVNPYINFSDLANYEFALPPLDEQRRITHLLTAAREVAEGLLFLTDAHERVMSSMLQDIFSQRSGQRPLAEWCASDITYGIVQAGPHVDDGIPYIRVSDMTIGARLNLTGMLRTSPEIAARYRRSEVRAGDIVVALRGPVGLVRIVPGELDGANLTQGTARVAVADRRSRDYVYWALQAVEVQRQYLRYSKGSTFSEISLEALRSIEIPMIDVGKQQEVAHSLGALESGLERVRHRRNAATQVFRDLLAIVLEDRA